MFTHTVRALPGQFTLAYVLMFLLTVGSARADGVTNGDSPLPSAEQPVVAEPAELDVGRVQAGSIVHASLNLRNRSSRSLRITRTITGCGCTVATTNDHSIAPGGTCDVDVRFQAGRAGSQISRKIQFQFDGITEPVSISLRGTAVDWIDISTSESSSMEQPLTAFTLNAIDGLAFRVLATEPPSAITDFRSTNRHQLSLPVTKDGKYRFLISHPKVSQISFDVAGSGRQRERSRSPRELSDPANSFESREPELQVIPSRLRLQTTELTRVTVLLKDLKGVVNTGITVEATGIQASVDSVKPSSVGIEVVIRLAMDRRTIPDRAALVVRSGGRKGHISLQLSD